MTVNFLEMKFDGTKYKDSNGVVWEIDDLLDEFGEVTDYLSDYNENLMHLSTRNKDVMELWWDGGLGLFFAFWFCAAVKS